MTRLSPLQRLFLLALAACCSTAAVDAATATLHRTPLSTWQFRSLNHSIALANVTTPGTSHTHLVDGGVLAEDPYYRFNELDMQWIAHTTWVYETTLPSSASATDGEGHARVVFETLDGVAHVALNGESLGAPAVNAFRPHAFALPARLLKTNSENTLQVVFTPPLDYMQQAAAAYPYDVPATRNFNVWAEPSHRPFLRKAGSDFGWDWGPAYVTTGIAGPAYVEWVSSVSDEEEDTKGEIARLEDLDVVYVFPASDDFSVVHGNVTLTIQSVLPLRNVTLRLLFNGHRRGDDLTVALSETLPIDALTASTKVSISFTIEKPTLWWPAGYGDPHLYDLSVEAYDATTTLLTTLSHRVGFRSIALIQDPTDAGGVHGTTFYFRINNVPIFIKGANWIPNDSFPTRVTPEKLAFLLDSAVASNMNMLRVWGGGRYESDAFYATCDRLGLLVWHEFMFACAMYPRDRAFLREVENEVAFQTTRLRKFTSVAIWGGNNENENMMEAFANGDFVATPFNRDVAVADFTAVFVDTLRPLVVTLDASRPFVDTSPSNGLLSEDPYVKRWGKSTNAIASGDVHYYNYDGDCQDPAMYPHARFVSEFGFQSMPSRWGLEDVSAPDDWASFQAFWKLLKFRERHEHGTQQMATQIQRRFHVPFPFLDEDWLTTPLDARLAIGINVSSRVEAYLYLTQLQQGLCYQTAIEAWRRGRNAVRGGTMGILYWQLNDVWQGTSWSSIEFSGRWKSLQYAVQRAYAPVLLSIVQDGDSLIVYGLSDLRDRDLQLSLVYEVVAADTARVVTSSTTAAVQLPRLSSEPLDHVAIAALLIDGCDVTHCFLRVRCTTEPVTPCDDAFFFFAPYKQLALRHGRVHITNVTAVSTGEEGDQKAFEVVLQSDDFVALFVEVEAPRMRGLWNRNSFHAVGNATQTLRFVPANASLNLTADAFAQLLEVRWLQQTYETEAAVSVA